MPPWGPSARGFRLSDVLAEQTDTSANARQAGVLRKLADLGSGAAMRVLGRWYAVGYGAEQVRGPALVSARG
jgi:hypothetical protein